MTELRAQYSTYVINLSISIRIDSGHLDYVTKLFVRIKKSPCSVFNALTFDEQFGIDRSISSAHLDAMLPTRPIV